MFYDVNDIQLLSEVSEVMDEDMGKKYEVWGWYVQIIEGNDFDVICKVLDVVVVEIDCFFFIIGKIIMGKGVVIEEGEFFECQVFIYGKFLSGVGVFFEKIVKVLGGDLDNLFVVFLEVVVFYEEVKIEKYVYVE